MSDTYQETFEKLEKAALKVKADRDALLEACEVALKYIGIRGIPASLFIQDAVNKVKGES